ncbi:MAG: DUF72 domain-containing protein [Chloroflexi bacterium]|nr:DUF72 domain-containing protein [Chloroflexota bacterium]
MTVLIGTSGFSYTDWVGPVYPADLPKEEWLSYYANEFATCELNFSFYRIPDSRSLARMVAKVPDGFVFSVKAFQGITHERKEPETLIKRSVDALAPLLDAGKFACVLAQFPHSFHANQANRAYIRRLREGFGDLPVVVEFRSRDWVSAQTFSELRALGLGFCCVDQPDFRNLIPRVAMATSSIAYVRFHGRNADKWWQHDEAWERYDYTYREDELEEWVPKVQHLDAEAPLTLIYMNNHWQGQAVGTARQLQSLLRGLD